MKKATFLLFTFIAFFSFLNISNAYSIISGGSNTEIPYCKD
jgi:hypothetical protein